MRYFAYTNQVIGVDVSFGQNLQRLREGAGLSQSELAGKTGLAVRTIQNWEINRNQPRLDAIIKLARALGVPIEELAVSEDPEKKRRGRPPKATPSTPPAGELEATGKKQGGKRK